MTTTPVPYSRFVALFPHDDFLRPIRAYRSRLFASGHRGAFSFPACIPLGNAREALKRDQLTSLAVYLRQQAEKVSGYFDLGSPGQHKYLNELDLSYTPMPLNPPFHQPPTVIPLEPFVEPDFILCVEDPLDSAKRAAPAELFDPAPKESAFPLRFRAGFVANLVVWPADHGEAGLSFCWERGTPVWLPAPPRRKTPK